jgi:NADPH:quinone reductase
MTTKQIALASRPIGAPTSENFRFENFELPEIEAGQVLVKNLYYSVDPYLRGRMNDAKSYVPPFQIDNPIEGSVIAEVSKSKSDEYKNGDLVLGMLPWRKETIADGKFLQKIDTSIAPARYYLGILGMTGLTAYVGMIHICKPKATETVVVSGAAGAVGMAAGQIAKIQGCYVIGIAGSDEKVELLTKKYGFDGAINYKKTVAMNKAIAELCPNGVDVYFDNVGGDISDAVINNISFHARVAICGQISLYNSTSIPIGPRLQPMLLTRSVLMQGFIVRNYQSLYPEGFRQLGQWMKEGSLKYAETVVHGFEQLPAALLGLFHGENTGKMIVEA